MLHSGMDTVSSTFPTGGYRYRNAFQVSTGTHFTTMTTISNRFLLRTRMACLALAALIVAFSSTPVLANTERWTKVGTSSDQSDHYVDYTTYKRSDGIVKIWTLTNFAVLQEHLDDKFLSSASLREYRCEDREMRQLHYVRYSLFMGEGKIVYSGDNPNPSWTALLPNSVGENIIQLVCNYKPRPKK